MDGAPLGVIEGYYGTPWTWEERAACIDALARHGANVYVWAPKSEPRHRDLWREPFTPDEIAGFAMLARRSPSVSVSVGLTPGPDSTIDDVVEKVAPVLGAGCRIVTLCFDDLPELDAARRHRTIANGVADRTGAAVWIVPTHYAGLASSPYLAEILDGLRDDIGVMWTGEHVVNDAITAEHARSRAAASNGRLPLLWDNTPVNDAMMSSLLHLGPHVGRDADLRGKIAGLLLNPMSSMQASLPTIVSACAWWRGDDAFEAWERVVDELGLRTLAEATAFPDDAHWPGDSPSREWLSSVATMVDPDDDYLQPWVDAARAGAKVSLAALDAIDAVESGAPAAALTRHFVQMLGLDAWLRSPVRTLGSGPRSRPVWTQDEHGRFAPTHRSIVSSQSIPERLVALANATVQRRSANPPTA